MQIEPIAFPAEHLATFDWEAVFERPAPIELEIGSGKGTFLLRRASAYPERNFFGIEWANEFYRYACDRIRRHGLENVRLLRADAAYFMRVICPPDSLAALHVYHPDPWPKKRHHKRRLIQPSFVDEATRCLQVGAIWAVQTDHAEYFSVIEPLLAKHPCYESVPFDAAGVELIDGGVATNFEVKYRAEGREIYQIAVRRLDVPFVSVLSPKPGSKEGRPDILNVYRDCVDQQLQIHASRTPIRVIDVLFRPSFNPEARIVVIQSALGTELHIKHFIENKWFYDGSRRDEVPGYDPARNHPRILSESVQIDSQRADEFWAALEKATPESIPDGDQFGCDGMSVDVRYKHYRTEHAFSAWGLDCSSPQGYVTDLVYGMAWQSLVDQNSVECLEQIWAYLRSELPAREIHGGLRIFGRLSAADQNALGDRFSLHMNDNPFVVDMSQFEGMGTILHQIFAEFERRPGKTAWVVNDMARQHLSGVGILTNKMFTNMKQALDWLAENE